MAVARVVRERGAPERGSRGRERGAIQYRCHVRSSRRPGRGREELTFEPIEMVDVAVRGDRHCLIGAGRSFGLRRGVQTCSE